MKANEFLLWEQTVPSICRFCAFAKKLVTEETVYCERKKRYMSEDGQCKKFKYDILKKEVRRRKATVPCGKEQFNIDNL